MIRVQRQTQPRRFNERVGSPGRDFLLATPRPTRDEWTKHAFWTRILPELRTRYGCVCAYSCHWIPADTGFGSVDHFKPKNLYPKDAYKWRNYRLVCGRLNGRKGDYEDVLDPFAIQDGWFVLDFPSMQIKPADTLPDANRRSVQATIDRLKLNDDDTCVQARLDWLKAYCDTPGLPFAMLRQNAPFIAMELGRQGLQHKIKAMLNIAGA